MGGSYGRRRTRRLRRVAAVIGTLVLAGALTQISGGSSASAAPPKSHTPSGSTSSCGGEVPAAKSDGTAWVCTFDDEFNESSLNTAVWTPVQTSVTGGTTGTAPYQACYVNSTNNVYLNKGSLRLTVRKESSPLTCKTLSGSFTTNYTAGAVSSVGRFGQTYGRFEVRAKLPSTTIKGLQETLWLWPVNSVKYAAYGPAWSEPSGEIDFAEFYSAVSGRNIPFIHYYVDTTKLNPLTQTNQYTSFPAPNNEPGTNCLFDNSSWNNYSVVWQPGRITMYVNGNTCLVDNYIPGGGLSSPAPFDQPFFIALSQALGVTVSNSDNGTTAQTPLPATTQIDYVRVWK